MRPRFAVPFALLVSLVAVALPGVATAHPVHNRGLTIAATPNPINSGDSVLIYGQLKGSDVAHQPIVLYHRVNPKKGYTVVSRTMTTSTGFYEFKRADGVVVSNREWFVRGPGATHSRTVHEKVMALVDLSSNTSQDVTNSPVLFTGQISPAHPHQRVLLQVQAGREGNGWRTVKSGETGPDSAFAISYRWRRPGVETVRVLLRKDARNVASSSDSLTITVEQKQAPSFTIASSQEVIPYGQSVSISGTLDRPGTNVVEPDTSVTLYGHTPGGTDEAIATAITQSNGSYSFPDQTPTGNMDYRVVTTLNPNRHTATLYQGVSDVVTLSATPTTVDLGQPVAFSGDVSPNKSGEQIYLQRLGANGYWHDVASGRIAADGSYSFDQAFGQSGAEKLRTRIFADGQNVGGASAPVTITVTDSAAPASSLPPAS